MASSSVPTMLQNDSNVPRSPRRSLVIKICCIIVAVPTLFALVLFWIYGTDTHHSSRKSIWWSQRGRNLIPPAASDITLRQDLLDHYVTYKISEAELNAFLDKRFARPGETLDSFSERSLMNPARIGKAIGPFGWVVTKTTVQYSYTASNGGAHHFYHDFKTGLTYQESAYW